MILRFSVTDMVGMGKKEIRRDLILRRVSNRYAVLKELPGQIKLFISYQLQFRRILQVEIARRMFALLERANKIVKSC